MRKILRAALVVVGLVCGAQAVSAQEMYLHIQTSDGWQVLNIDQVDRLTFTGDTMRATDSAGNLVTEIPQISLQTMKVDESSGVEVITDEQTRDNFELSADGRTAVANASGTLSVYATDGTRLVCIPEVKVAQKVHLEALPAGTYIITLDGQSTKAILR